MDRKQFKPLQLNLIVDYKDLGVFSDARRLIHFCIMKNMVIRKRPIVTNDVPASYFKMHWQATDNILDAESTIRGNKNGFKVSSRSVLHHAMHLAIVDSFGKVKTGDHRYLLLSEAISSAVDLFFAARLFSIKKAKPRFVSDILKVIDLKNESRHKVYVPLFNDIIADPFRCFQQIAVEIYDYLMVLERGLVINGESEKNYFEEINLKKNELKFFHLFSYLDFLNFTTYSLKYCGNKLRPQEPRASKLQLVLEHSSSFDDFLCSLGVTEELFADEAA